jgi:hypothetical protein
MIWISQVWLAGCLCSIIVVIGVHWCT